MRKKIISGLALAMQTRGTHSTGIGYVCKDDSYIYKMDTNAYEFIQQEKYHKAFGKNPSTMIGHTRWATQGAITAENAHPFRKGKIIGSHNGHVTNFRTAVEENIEVDSEAIFILLNKEKTYKEAFEQLRGMFAITWFDIENPHTLNMVRDGNPLFLVKIKELDTLFWCSEVEALQAIIETTVSSKGRKFYEIKEDTVYSFDENLEVKKQSVKFGTYTSYAYDNQKYDSWKNTKEEKNEVQKLIGQGTVSYADDTEESELDILIPQKWDMLNANDVYMITEMQVCDVCLRRIETQTGFYYSLDDSSVICNECATNEMDLLNDNIIFINYEDYRELTGIYFDIEERERYDKMNLKYE